jgi:toxin ParE1/3/4
LGSSKGSSPCEMEKMTFSVILHPSAQAEYDEAYRYYEDERPGLGDEFEECIQEVLGRIAINPEMHSKVYKDVRRGVVSRFPYVIYYRKKEDHVKVISVFHSKRNPLSWKRQANLDLDNGE